MSHVSFRRHVDGIYSASVKSSHGHSFSVMSQEGLKLESISINCGGDNELTPDFGGQQDKGYSIFGVNSPHSSAEEYLP